MKVWQVWDKIKSLEKFVEFEKRHLENVHETEKAIYATAINNAENEIERLRKLEVPGV